MQLVQHWEQHVTLQGTGCTVVPRACRLKDVPVSQAPQQALWDTPMSPKQMATSGLPEGVCNARGIVHLTLEVVNLQYATANKSTSHLASRMRCPIHALSFAGGAKGSAAQHAGQLFDLRCLPRASCPSTLHVLACPCCCRHIMERCTSALGSLQTNR